ncbi:MAG: M20/M25/M40 family metallo-hydrolase, partial [Acinetobacter sp.]
MLNQMYEKFYKTNVIALSISALLFSSSSMAMTLDQANTAVTNLISSNQFKKISAIIDQSHEKIVEENIKLQQIASPPFGESEKAKAFAQLMTEAGVTTKIDKEGNVLALWKGTKTKNNKVTAVIAHLDTVFQQGTDLKIRRDGTKIYGPGILDDTRGLVALLAYVRAMKQANITTEQDILFVGSVGEEGLGDLRGVKYLFNEGEYKGRIQSAIIVDGGEPERVVNEGPGSKRYEVHFKGPGGHSYKAFGLVNPMYALGNAMAEFGKLKVPQGTTYSVGVVGGGTSVNAIPNDAWMQVDMRSTSSSDLKNVESSFIQIVNKAANEENSFRKTTTGKISLDSKLVGDRPPGQTKNDDGLIQLSLAATRTLGWQPQLASSSTDANIPMSLGIPAVAIGAGVGGNAHSAENEYLDVEKDSSVKAL